MLVLQYNTECLIAGDGTAWDGLPANSFIFSPSQNTVIRPSGFAYQLAASWFDRRPTDSAGHLRDFRLELKY